MEGGGGKKVGEKKIQKVEKNVGVKNIILKVEKKSGGKNKKWVEKKIGVKKIGKKCW